MYTSGQFAGMFRVSKKLLRYYNEIGLLTPAETDSTNGYFYYGQVERDRMKQVMYLRAFQIPLPEIEKMIELPREQWLSDIRKHLSSIRSQQQAITRIETELLFLEEQILTGGSMKEMERKIEFNIRVFNLENDISVLGRSARTKHGSPEHMPTIQGLIEDYFGDDVPAMIPNHLMPPMRFGICAEFSPESGEFTYMMGDQTTEPVAENEIPNTLRSYVIPAGYYACVTFSAPDIETITTQSLGSGYDELFGWLGQSNEWESSTMGVAYEVYENTRFEVASWPEMDIWTPVKRKLPDGNE